MKQVRVLLTKELGRYDLSFQRVFIRRSTSSDLWSVFIWIAFIRPARPARSVCENGLLSAMERIVSLKDSSVVCLDLGSALVANNLVPSKGDQSQVFDVT